MFSTIPTNYHRKMVVLDGKQIFYLYSMVTVDIKLNIIGIVWDVIIRINFMGLKSTGNDFFALQARLH